MKVIGDYLMFAQRAIHVGSALWFFAVLLYVNPSWPEEWRDIKILLVINVGITVINSLLYTFIFWCRHWLAKRAK